MLFSVKTRIVFPVYFLFSCVCAFQHKQAPKSSRGLQFTDSDRHYDKELFVTTRVTAMLLLENSLNTYIYCSEAHHRLEKQIGLEH